MSSPCILNTDEKSKTKPPTMLIDKAILTTIKSDAFLRVKQKNI